MLQGSLTNPSSGALVQAMVTSVRPALPPSTARALWEAAGRPPIRWFDCGHYSAAGYLLPGLREAVDFLAAEVPR